MTRYLRHADLMQTDSQSLKRFFPCTLQMPLTLSRSKDDDVVTSARRLDLVKENTAARADEPFPDSNSGGGGGGKSFVACKVCGDKASGYHYGVTSCEGCKGFFRRSIQKQIDYKCLRDKQCLVIRLNRNRCQYCRFRKCLDVGMSKDSVRYGRVPKRSREKSEADPPTARVTNQSAIDSEKPSLITTEPRQQASMYDIITTISDAYLYHCAYTEAKTRGLVRKPAMFSMSEQQQSNALDGNNADFQRIVLWQQFAYLLTPSVQQVVEFAKRIPGFGELPQDDKLLCIKLGFFEVWLVQAARLISPQDSTITFTDGTTLSRQQMEIMFDRDFVNQMFNFVHCFNELQLSDAEIGLYSAVVLATAEREGIYDVKSLSHLQDQMVGALRYKLGSSSSALPTLLAKVRELRAIGEGHAQHLRWFRTNWRHLNIPALFAEVFDIPSRPEGENGGGR